MKYVVLVPDGAADYPLKELGNKTPLQVANIPNMDFLARNGIVGTVKTVPDGMEPASDVANLAIMGYDPAKYYTGRGPFEAASMGIFLAEEDMAFRCNLVTVSDNILEDYSAGHITTEEARVLIEMVNKKLGRDDINFYPGISYRHLMILKGQSISARCIPPHDISGQLIDENLPKGEGANLLKKLILSSREFLESHEINLKRKAQGKRPANMIWLWGQGTNPQMPTLAEKYGISGSVISAVNLIKGIGFFAGLKILEVPGATGYFDTDYQAKGRFALQALTEEDFVFVHVEAPDEAGHIGDIEEKIRAIENIDAKIVGPLLDGLRKFRDYKILVVVDHATPIPVKTHVADAVPFAIYSPGIEADQAESFDEMTAKNGSVHLDKGYELMDLFVAK